MAFQRNGIHFSYFFCSKEENERWKRKKGKRVVKRIRKMNSSEMTSHFLASIFASLRIHQIPKTMWRRWYRKERRQKTHLEKSETIKTNRNKPPPPPFPTSTSFSPVFLSFLLPSYFFLLDNDQPITIKRFMAHQEEGRRKKREEAFRWWYISILRRRLRRRPNQLLFYDFLR